MTGVLVATFLRQRMQSPVRIALLFTGFAFSLLPVLIERNLLRLGETSAVMFAVIVAAGAIGQDISSGVVQLTFARPLERWRYVLARWLAASLLAGAIGVALVGVGAAVVLARGATFAPADALRLALEMVFAAAGVASVVVCLSSIVNGLADVGVLVVLSIASSIMQGVGPLIARPWVGRIGQELAYSLTPTLLLSPFLAGDWSAWPKLVAYASMVTLALAVAVFSLSRREFSYAAD